MEKVVFDPDMLDGKIMQLNTAIMAKCPGIGNGPAPSPPPAPSPLPAPSSPPATALPAQPTMTSIKGKEKELSIVPETPTILMSPASAATAHDTPLPPIFLPALVSGSSKRPIDAVSHSRHSVDDNQKLKWIKDMEGYLRDPKIVGDDWKDAVDALVSLESAYGFKSVLKSLSTTKRPAAIQHWVSRGRSEHVPKILLGMVPSEFQQQLVAWWNELQPGESLKTVVKSCRR
ncbi:hypothetical protein VKT23_016604 [Stygiomarasmius scandens]|uniref:Uncharacterized protein n=1 Tax=Marasmiellus scandens TaxID=2682957 RepID=A0ABR1IYT0_9AGAR